MLLYVDGKLGLLLWEGRCMTGILEKAHEEQPHLLDPLLIGEERLNNALRISLAKAYGWNITGMNRHMAWSDGVRE